MTSGSISSSVRSTVYCTFLVFKIRVSEFCKAGCLVYKIEFGGVGLPDTSNGAAFKRTEEFTVGGGGEGKGGDTDARYSR